MTYVQQVYISINMIIRLYTIFLLWKKTQTKITKPGYLLKGMFLN